MTIPKRLGNLETRVAALPWPRGALPMMFDEFIRLYPHLSLTLEHLASRLIGEEPRVLEWTKDQVTPALCRALIEAVQAEDVKARAAGKPLPSSGLLGGVADEAEVFIRELESQVMSKCHGGHDYED